MLFQANLRAEAVGAARSPAQGCLPANRPPTDTKGAFLLPPAPVTHDGRNTRGSTACLRGLWSGYSQAKRVSVL